jgi:hypothetical protein
MPLRRTLDERFPEGEWRSFVPMWASHILTRLNISILSERFRADLSVNRYKFGFDPVYVEPDQVVTSPDAPEGFPPAPSLSVVGEFAEPQTVDVVHDDVLQRRVAAVCIADPTFTRSPVGRRMFAAKCLTYLQRGTAVVVVNAVAEHPADLHAEIMSLYGRPELRPAHPLELAVVVYRVAHVVGRTEEHFRLDLWTYPFTVGADLPTVPLWLAHDLNTSRQLAK